MTTAAKQDTSTDIATLREAQVVTSPGGSKIDFSSMKEVMAFSEIMATAKGAIPAELINNVGACMGITLQAIRWGMDPFSVAQKTHNISGKMGYEAQLINAVVTSMAPTTGRLEYDWYGDWSRVIGNFKTVKSQKGNDYQKPNWTLEDERGLGIKVWATMRGETEPRVLDLLLSQATVRNSTLWASDPKQQLAYLAVKRWARLYCPDVIMGVYTSDELQEDSRAPRDITPQAEPTETRAKSILTKLQDEPVVEDTVEEVVEEVAQGEPDGPPLTYAMVADQINKATTPDEIRFAAQATADYVHAIVDETVRDQHRRELTELYKRRQNLLKEEQALAK